MRNIIYDYLLQMIGLQYKWGGDDTIHGFDCSGLALEVLAAFGLPLSDRTAHGLYQWCQGEGLRRSVQCGALAFYGRPEKITHVAICINQDLVIEAGGGGSRTTSVEAAARDNAFVRIRPLRHRSDLQDVMMPDYPCYLMH